MASDPERREEERSNEPKLKTNGADEVLLVMPLKQEKKDEEIGSEGLAVGMMQAAVGWGGVCVVGPRAVKDEELLEGSVLGRDEGTNLNARAYRSL